MAIGGSACSLCVIAEHQNHSSEIFFPFVDISFYRGCLAKPSEIPICQEKEHILIIQWRNVGSGGRGGERWPQPENFRVCFLSRVQGHPGFQS